MRCSPQPVYCATHPYTRPAALHVAAPTVQRYICGTFRYVFLLYFLCCGCDCAYLM